MQSQPSDPVSPASAPTAAAQSADAARGAPLPAIQASGPDADNPETPAEEATAAAANPLEGANPSGDVENQELAIDPADLPAFPTTADTVDNGLTIRQWYAGMIIQGLTIKGLEVSSDRVLSDEDKAKMLAERSYVLADALLAIGCPQPQPASDEPIAETRQRRKRRTSRR